MQEDSIISNISNLNYIGNSNSCGFNDFLSKNFDWNNLGDFYKDKANPDLRELDYEDLMISPVPMSSPFNHNGFLEKCWGEPRPEKYEIDQMPEYNLEPKEHGSETDARKEGKEKQSPCELSSGHSPTESLSVRNKNQTKNIPKNFGKAIITFIEKERELIKEILDEYGIEYQAFLTEMMIKKKLINTIANLRELWVENENSECLRRISNQFLRKHSMSYIFNSRISNYNSHIKYRARLLEAIKTPKSFKHIKEY